MQLDSLGERVLTAQSEKDKLNSAVAVAESEYAELSKPPEPSKARLMLVARLNALVVELEPVKDSVYGLEMDLDRRVKACTRMRLLKDDLALERGRARLFAERVKSEEPDALETVDEECAAIEKQVGDNIERIKIKTVGVAPRSKDAKDVLHRVARRKEDIEKGTKKVNDVASEVEHWEKSNNEQTEILDELEAETKIKRCSEDESVSPPASLVEWLCALD